MQVDSIHNSFPNLETARKYIPLVSTVVCTIIIIAKVTIIPCLSERTLRDNSYLLYFSKISFDECLWGLIPIIGNIVFCIFDEVNGSDGDNSYSSHNDSAYSGSLLPPRHIPVIAVRPEQQPQSQQIQSSSAVAVPHGDITFITSPRQKKPLIEEEIPGQLLIEKIQVQQPQCRLVNLVNVKDCAGSEYDPIDVFDMGKDAEFYTKKNDSAKLFTHIDIYKKLFPLVQDGPRKIDEVTYFQRFEDKLRFVSSLAFLIDIDVRGKVTTSETRPKEQVLNGSFSIKQNHEIDPELRATRINAFLGHIAHNLGSIVKESISFKDIKDIEDAEDLRASGTTVLNVP